MPDDARRSPALLLALTLPCLCLSATTLPSLQEPDLFELVHQNDPMIKQYVSDPTRAYQEAMAAAGLNK